jgi:nucleotide-binding universal stress UspA family protein
MRWMIGADLGTRSHGALQFASWLCARSSANNEQQLSLTHVLDARLRQMLRTDLMAQLMERTRTELAAALDDANATRCTAERQVVEADSPEAGILQALEGTQSDALVIGRRSRREGHQLVRLGRTARRLLRRLPKPVVVVPPDLEAGAIGRGPILLATDLGSATLVAARFAAALAKELSSTVTVLHVDMAFESIPTFWGEPAVVPTRSRRIPADVDDWAREAGLAGVATRLAEGPTVEGVLQFARSEDASMIVCGSRRLDLVDRIFMSSTGTDLARLADRPVLVVPAT